MARPACLVCFISTVNDRIKKRSKKKPWKPGTSSGHTTNLKQSIFCLSISMVLTVSMIIYNVDLTVQYLSLKIGVMELETWKAYNSMFYGNLKNRITISSSANVTKHFCP